MTGSPPSIDTIRAAFEPHGLFLRGVVNVDDDEVTPALRNGDRAASVVLIGNVGGSIWPAFRAWQAVQTDCGGSDPLDAWSKAVIGPLAEAFEATPWFPSDAPWQPFQQWAMRAEGLRPSPLGILIHPQYGLWHGYRGALGFAQRLDQPAASDGAHPCDNCRDKPCLRHCPVTAVTVAGFDVPGCRGHLRTDAGRRDCMASGCLARNKCPVGAEHRYTDDQLAFHMAALSL